MHEQTETGVSMTPEQTVEGTSAAPASTTPAADTPVRRPLTRQQIRNRQRSRPIQAEDVPAPEFGEGETVRIRAAMGHERAPFEKRLSEHKEGDPWTLAGLRELLVHRVAVDDEGAALYPEGEEGMKALSEEWPATLIDRAFAVAMRLAGLDKKAKDEAKAGLDQNPTRTGSAA